MTGVQTCALPISGHSIFIGRDFGTTKSYSEDTAALIDAEVKRIFDEAAALCEKILLENKNLLEGVAEYLLKNESMDGETFHYFCEHGELPPVVDPTIEPPAKHIHYVSEPAEPIVLPEPEISASAPEAPAPDANSEE